MSDVEEGVLRIIDPDDQPAPLVVDSPHSGRQYPEDFGYAVDYDDLRSAEDAYVDQLCINAADAGATVLIADFPRAYIDVNRDEDDIDPAIIEGSWETPLNPGPKSDLGIGLLRQKLASGADIYDRKLTVEEIQLRIEDYHWPYHSTLASLIETARDHFGTAWHLSMHSMASHANVVTPDDGGLREFDMVLGDLDGRSCEAEFTDIVYTALVSEGFRVQINDPYKGAAITRIHGRPEEGVNSLQIEINRALYLDEKTTSKTDGFNPLRSSLTKVFKTVARYATAQCS